MKIKRKIIALCIFGLIAVSAYASASIYIFRSPVHGVSASGNLSNIIEAQQETDVACYNFNNVNKIGTWPGCKDMLIVNNAMLKSSGSSHFSIGGDESFAIYHSESGRTFTFEDSEDNIFTGQVNDFKNLFRGTSFNGSIEYWDTKRVLTMSYMFFEATEFNQSIQSWDTSLVYEMGRMFYGATSFNSPIGNWDTSSLVYMDSMFAEAFSFNQPIGHWDTSNVISMRWLFNNASSFNQDLSNWNVSHLATKPEPFDDNTTAWLLPKPCWGNPPGSC